MDVSVVVCTHNPREDYLRCVLAALRVQTLPKDRWELLLIDNASRIPLRHAWDISWHPSARHVQENELGLTAARLRGIRESVGGLLIFVDDDNVLEPDYLQEALAIARERPYLGAWGGAVVAGFEVTPPEWSRPQWPLLAIKEVTADHWSNSTNDFETAPCGAGLCVRRSVAEAYARKASQDALRIGLDRHGSDLSSCGDTDLAWTACDLGMGTGVFRNLRLTHLIPSSRLEESYLLRLTESIARSVVLLFAVRQRAYPLRRVTMLRRLTRKVLQHVTLNARERRFLAAKSRGEQAAHTWLMDLAQSPGVQQRSEGDDPAVVRERQVAINPSSLP